MTALPMVVLPAPDFADERMDLARLDDQRGILDGREDGAVGEGIFDPQVVDLENGRPVTRSSFHPQFWIEAIAEPIAHDVDRKDEQHEGQGREEGDPPDAREHKFVADADQRSKGRDRWAAFRRRGTTG